MRLLKKLTVEMVILHLLITKRYLLACINVFSMLHIDLDKKLSFIIWHGKSLSLVFRLTIKCHSSTSQVNKVRKVQVKKM